jgi:integrase/recombinase XerD
MSAPVITIFVRHTPGCKYAGDEFTKRCNCRKHFRWTHGGKQFRRAAGTRSWAEAEDNKTRLTDQLAGRTPERPVDGLLLADAIQTFEADRKAKGLQPKVLAHYSRQLRRLREFSEVRGLIAVSHALTLENLIAYRGTWTAIGYESSGSRNTIQRHLTSFFRFCFNAGWIPRIPALSSIKVHEPETMPLTEAEYAKILKHAKGKTRVIIQLMRWSGLAVRDASTLKRSDLHFAKGVNKIIRDRTKTGTPLYIPIPAEVAAEVKAVMNGNPVYVFWDKQIATADENRHASHVGTRIAEVFTEAGIVSEGHMISHRLRCTFAVDLLQKGVPLEHVSKLLGHKSVTTTERHYAKWVKGRQDRLDHLVSEAWKK